MRTPACFLVVTVLMLAGCDFWRLGGGENPVSEDPDWETPDGTASAVLDGREYAFRVFAQPSAYDPSEVVLRAYADSLDRTLMLTFDLEEGQADVNTAMTGYWDLGLCIPFRKYVVAGPEAAVVHVRSYERGTRRVRGTFALQVVSEDEPGQALTFTDGHFDVRLRHEPFEYCIEG